MSLLVASASGQTFSVDAYKQFLQENKTLSADGLELMHDAGRFKGEATTSFSAAAYSNEIDNVFSLTDYEKSLLNKNGFMVTERLTYPSFADAFHNVFIKDLPVFVSTDAILHAMHKSYDEILIDIEEDILIADLSEMLGKMRDQLPALSAKYAGKLEMGQSIDDADVYLTVAAQLLTTDEVKPMFNRNKGAVEALLTLVASEGPGMYPLFGKADRTLDFSQFTVRGHYTRTPELGRYFKSMMWLGRTEIYLSETKGASNPPPAEDIQRQTIMAVLLAEAARDGQAFELLENIDKTLRFMIGESDNVTMQNLLELTAETGASNASDLLDQGMLKSFQEKLAAKPYAGQKILSQILYGDPLSPDKITPASAFLLLGQRFIIDSYVMANVVHDKVEARMLPSSLDVLFSLGNDAALQLLQPEVRQYNYAKQLAGLRYLIDSYEPGYWNSTLYTGWLGAIRTLNPPQSRTHLPRFMQTAAWWQEKMNTQLASWAQLRHDNLLYAKQSYSGGVGCSYPKGYVEPIPEFYSAVAAYAVKGKIIFTEMGLTNVVDYFTRLETTSKTLEEIARKELDRKQLNDEEIDFLKTMLSHHTIGCGEVVYDGWYPGLFYAAGVDQQDLVVADVHTSPTDADGNPVGWVFHVGTGPIDMAVVVCDDSEDGGTAYIGPVMSYHEHVTTNFKRLTDEEWAESYMEKESIRPDWTNVYLATKEGTSRGEIVTLKTDVSSVGQPSAGSKSAGVTTHVFPNPFGTSATINFTIPSSLAGKDVVITIHDGQGKPVAELMDQVLPSGNYMTRWDGTASDGTNVVSGVYFYTVKVGGVQTSGTIERIAH